MWGFLNIFDENSCNFFYFWFLECINDLVFFSSLMFSLLKGICLQKLLLICRFGQSNEYVVDCPTQFICRWIFICWVGKNGRFGPFFVVAEFVCQWIEEELEIKIFPTKALMEYYLQGNVQLSNLLNIYRYILTKICHQWSSNWFSQN